MKDIPAISRQYECTKPLRIYWSGVNWKRKGGNVALDCCKELISRGYKIEFHITGMRQLSQEIYELSWVHNHGFLDKNNPDEYRQLIDIMSKQDLFLFRAELNAQALHYARLMHSLYPVSSMTPAEQPITSKTIRTVSCCLCRRLEKILLT